MPTSAEVLLLDTSAALPLLVPGHEKRAEVLRAVAGHRLGLAGHAEFETYSVLTRMPPPLRRPPPVALRLIRANFPETRRLDASAGTGLLEELTVVGIAGGQVYDALIAWVALHHNLPLVTADRRALRTYRALGTQLRVV